MKVEKIQVILAIFAMLVGLTLSTHAQGKGQAKKGQTVVKQDQDRGQDKDMDRDRDKDKDQDRDQDRDKDQDRDRIRASDLQRDQLRANLVAMDRIRLQVRDMIRECENGAFAPTQGKQQHEQLRERIRTMEQEEERVLAGLNAYQKNRFQKDLRNIQQHRERVNNRLETMEQEMNQKEFDRIQHQNHLREIESAIKKWEEQHRHMEKHMVSN